MRDPASELRRISLLGSRVNSVGCGVMEPFPELRTERLVLREFTLGDAPELHRLAQARKVARMMLRHPYPYEEGMAEEMAALAERIGRRVERIYPA